MSKFNLIVTVLSLIVVVFVASLWAVQPSTRTTSEARDFAYSQLRHADHWSDGYAPSWILSETEPLREELAERADAVRIVLGTLGATQDQLVEATRLLTLTITKIESVQRSSDAKRYPLLGKGYDR